MGNGNRPSYKHHYVPQFYLNCFKNGDNSLFAYNKKSKESFFALALKNFNKTRKLPVKDKRILLFFVYTTKSCLFTENPIILDVVFGSFITPITPDYSLLYLHNENVKEFADFLTKNYKKFILYIANVRYLSIDQ